MKEKKKPQRKSKTAPVAPEPIPQGIVLAPATLPPQATTALTVKQQTAIVRKDYSPDEIELIKNTVAKGTTDLELRLFLAVCKERRLSPITKQVHCVKRKVRQDDGSYSEVMTIQTGIDGYRAIAERSQKYAPSEKEARVEDIGKADFRVTMWVKKFLQGVWHEIPATAYFREFVQLRWIQGTPEPVAMWKKMPINQLTKCAEALALRKAFPEELGGVYVNEELDHLSSGNDTPDGKGEGSKNVKELGTLTPSQTPNRGHDQEGMQQGKCPKTAGSRGRCKFDNGHAGNCEYVFVAKGAAPPETPKAAEPKKTETPKAEPDSKPDPIPAERLGATVPMVLKRIDPRMKKLTPEQDAANKAAFAKAEPQRYEEQPYLILHCEDQNFAEYSFHVWDKNLHEACARALNKNCVFMASKNGKYYNVEDVVSVNGVAHARGEDKVSRPVSREGLL